MSSVASDPTELEAIKPCVPAPVTRHCTYPNVLELGLSLLCHSAHTEPRIALVN